jgi:hypothetical protein
VLKYFLSPFTSDGRTAEADGRARHAGVRSPFHQMHRNAQATRGLAAFAHTVGIPAALSSANTARRGLARGRLMSAGTIPGIPAIPRQRDRPA